MIEGFALEVFLSSETVTLVLLLWASVRHCVWSVCPMLTIPSRLYQNL